MTMRSLQVRATRHRKNAAGPHSNRVIALPIHAALQSPRDGGFFALAEVVAGLSAEQTHNLAKVLR